MDQPTYLIGIHDYFSHEHEILPLLANGKLIQYLQSNVYSIQVQGDKFKPQKEMICALYWKKKERNESAQLKEKEEAPKE